MPLAIANALDDELEYIYERLIGIVPENIEAIVEAVRNAEPRRTILVGEDGHPMSRSDCPDQEAEDPEPIEDFDALFDDPAWQAEEAAAERRHEWEVSQRDRVDAEFVAWLDDRAEQFEAQRSEWWNERHRQLRAEYEARNK
ncbi:hypothetical protein [Plantibacter flavus]|uniref:hypothetical protein n=1 Tax=Plantibacter flavus TaxID=150123 RepID=UPI00117BE995|nr:hypothetical protein [Plantibacter flavus]